jgi:hypothetical protein
VTVHGTSGQKISLPCIDPTGTVRVKVATIPASGTAAVAI